MKAASLAIAASSFGALLSAPIAAQVTQRVNVSYRGTQAVRAYSHWATVSAQCTPDGRTIAFRDLADNLVPGDTNHCEDIFVRDRRTGTTERVSVSSSGAEADGNSYGCWITPDGRYVGMTSDADNLVAGDTNHCMDVFIHDRQQGTTERVSVGPNGTQGDDESFGVSISDDGRYVAFVSFATNLVIGDTNDSTDVFVRDRWTGTTERVSVASDGSQAIPGFDDMYSFAMSGDGRFVAFATDAGNLVPGDTNAEADVFVRDRRNGTTERVSVSSSGQQQSYDWGYEFQGCSISADGRYVGFVSPADNLVPGDTNHALDAFVHDRVTGSTERVSISTGGVEADSGSWTPALSADGRFALFDSWATNLVPLDTNGKSDVFLRDRIAGTTERVSLTSTGAQANRDSSAGSISPEGRFVTFTSWANNLVPFDTNGGDDAFVRDRFGGPAFTSLCEPGSHGVTACPCSNPPGGTDRGCDNSAVTGGAALSASGGTFLSSDSLEFRTQGETPAALSILMQGNAVIPAGVVYGQGVRCVGGSVLRRLFVKRASGGSITTPDFEAGDTTISASSAAKGDLIQPGESRGYLVIYRDPVVLGGCPAAATFNATQTGQITWSP
jgi:Tol biopolymer transport system component